MVTSSLMHEHCSRFERYNFSCLGDMDWTFDGALRTSCGQGNAAGPRPGLATYAFSGKPLPCCKELRLDHLLLMGHRDGDLLLK